VIVAALIFLVCMGVLGRLSGSGFGKQWGVSWLPEALHSLPYGLAPSLALYPSLAPEQGWWAIAVFIVCAAISYAGFQSGTWMLLRWRSHDDPNTERDSTLKPIIDWVAGLLQFKLGDEGYAWIASGVRGFITTLPVGGLGAVFFPAGDEIGTHASKVGLKEDVAREFLRSGLGAISILIFMGVS